MAITSSVIIYLFLESTCKNKAGTGLVCALAVTEWAVSKYRKKFKALSPTSSHLCASVTKQYNLVPDYRPRGCDALRLGR